MLGSEWGRGEGPLPQKAGRDRQPGGRATRRWPATGSLRSLPTSSPVGAQIVEHRGELQDMFMKSAAQGRTFRRASHVIMVFTPELY